VSGAACTCGCCETASTAGARPANRPGLSVLQFRVGRHDSFLAAMLARLSASDLPALAALTTRDSEDPSIALLDAWATVGDVLAFYQERIANEGYLATATERQSLIELGRLVGYQPRPGVAASVYLAYDLEAASSTVIPQGTRAQSVPGPGELPQTYETSAPLEARAAWNSLDVRMSRPQQIGGTPADLWLAGTATRLQPGDLLVIEISDEKKAAVRSGLFVAAVEPDADADRTHVVFVGGTPTASEKRSPIDLATAIGKLSKPPARPPLDVLRLVRDQGPSLNSAAAGGLALLASTNRISTASLRDALSSSPQKESSSVRVFAMRLRSGLFGRNAPPKPDPPAEINLVPVAAVQFGFPHEWTWSDGDVGTVALPESRTTVYLDGAHPGVVAPSFIALQPDTRGEAPNVAADEDQPIAFHDVASASVTGRLAYGMSGQTTTINLATQWRDSEDPPTWSTAIRGTTVYAAPEELALADVPVTAPVGPPLLDGADGSEKVHRLRDPDGTSRSDGLEIALGDLYDGLQPGRVVIVSGERADLPGVRATELAMIGDVRAGLFVIGDATIPGDRLYTFITLAAGLAHTYLRPSVVISGNVVHATHGETRREVLGSGDASAALQRFGLKQPPLTYVSAPTASGVENTLEVRVDELLWHEAPSLAALGPSDRGYTVERADDGAAAVVFGNGARGARLPTGVENVRAVYRNGIGAAGNVVGQRITTLADRPLGVSAVTNPDAATGGADPETTDSARLSIPLPLRALDRLVSVTDYADFSRTFAGIGKAAAAALTNGRRRLVHVTVAGVDDIPLVDDDDVMTNLRQALTLLGDPVQPVVVARRELLVLVVRATVWLLPDYAWEFVEPKIRTALLDAFGFARQDLGQSVAASSVIATIQRVPGVDGVDLDVLASIPETVTPDQLEQLQLARNERIVVGSAHWDTQTTPHQLVPAQVAALLASVPDTLMLVQR
jgi:uncharacterized phage protein gp47/JayE